MERLCFKKCLGYIKYGIVYASQEVFRGILMERFVLKDREESYGIYTAETDNKDPCLSNNFILPLELMDDWRPLQMSF